MPRHPPCRGLIAGICEAFPRWAHQAGAEAMADPRACSLPSFSSRDQLLHQWLRDCSLDHQTLDCPQECQRPGSAVPGTPLPLGLQLPRPSARAFHLHPWPAPGYKKAWSLAAENTGEREKEGFLRKARTCDEDNECHALASIPRQFGGPSFFIVSRLHQYGRPKSIRGCSRPVRVVWAWDFLLCSLLFFALRSATVCH